MLMSHTRHILTYLRKMYNVPFISAGKLYSPRRARTRELLIGMPDKSNREDRSRVVATHSAPAEKLPAWPKLPENSLTCSFEKSSSDRTSIGAGSGSFWD